MVAAKTLDILASVKHTYGTTCDSDAYVNALKPGPKVNDHRSDPFTKSVTRGSHMRIDSIIWASTFRAGQAAVLAGNDGMRQEHCAPLCRRQWLRNLS